jgi:GDPmannose 4,6-dehydratase
VGRQATSRWVGDPRLNYIELDLADSAALDRLLERLEPACMFHCAAVHGSSGYAYEHIWRQALDVNVGSVHTCLEHIRQRARHARLFYSSSLKAFGEPPPPMIDETTPRHSTCLYGITKNAATDLVYHYRKQHGVHAAIGFFFNHDSPRRPDTYFIPRLVQHLISQTSAGGPLSGVASLDFWCDFGSAREFMELVADLMERDPARDAVFATGRPVHASELAAALAMDLGRAPPVVARSASEPPVRACLRSLLAAVGRLPKLGALDVARWILADRLERLSRERPA